MRFKEINPLCEMSLLNLRVQTNLGVIAEERACPQFVSWSVWFRFPSFPQGCFTDRIEQVVCYQSVSDILKEICLSEYHLIESLGYQGYMGLKKIVPSEVQIKIQLVKEKPPIPELQGGAVFCIQDWI